MTPAGARRIRRRERVFRRDDYTCIYCLRHLGRDNCTLDHVIPVSQGGTSAYTNLVTSCVACNEKKADRTLLVWLGVRRGLTTPGRRAITRRVNEATAKPVSGKVASSS